MNATSSFGAIAFTRLQEKREQHDQKQKELKIGAGGDTSIELPVAITNLITGNEYWVTAKSNRYRKLIREGNLGDLLELAKIALKKDNPAHWFAKVCSVKAWERTLDFLKKLYAVRKKAELVTERLGQDMAERIKSFVYKQIWLGKSVERHAVAAQEVGENRHKLFAFLCKQEGQETAVQNAA